MNSLYPLFFAAIAVMVAVNLTLARRFQSSLPIVYSLGLVAVGAIVYLQSLPATLPARLGVAVTAGAAAACLAVFWDRLMLLPVHAPRARLVAFLPGMAIIASGLVAALVSGALFAQQLASGDGTAFTQTGHTKDVRLMELTLLLEGVQQFAAVLLLPAIAVTALPPLRAGYRPALYSVAGLLFFLAMAAGSVMIQRGLLGGPGSPLVALTASGETLLLIGLLGEFLGFVFSLSNRAELHTAGRRQSEAAGIASYATELAERRYTRSKLGRVDTAALHRRLRHCLEIERIYCDEDLSLDRLAALCEVGRHELSEFLNQRLGTNFNRYINEYRVRAVQAAIRAEPDRTLLDIAFSAGFNSKTRFNSEFKRVTGQTPGEYRRRH